MKSEAIRRETCIIIRKDGEYLVGTICYSTDLRWSTSAYDAWRTRNRADAERVAGAVGGVMVLFNPIVNQRREMGAGGPHGSGEKGGEMRMVRAGGPAAQLPDLVF